MGLFSSYLSYRTGVKRGKKAANQASSNGDRSGDDRCRNCGHRRVQHDDHGRCPRYE